LIADRHLLGFTCLGGRDLPRPTAGAAAVSNGAVSVVADMTGPPAGTYVVDGRVATARAISSATDQRRRRRASLGADASPPAAEERFGMPLTACAGIAGEVDRRRANTARTAFSEIKFPAGETDFFGSWLITSAPWLSADASSGVGDGGR
jgi:hypothetical protein